MSPQSSPLPTGGEDGGEGGQNTEVHPHPRPPPSRGRGFVGDIFMVRG